MYNNKLRKRKKGGKIKVFEFCYCCLNFPLKREGKSTSILVFEGWYDLRGKYTKSVVLENATKHLFHWVGRNNYGDNPLK